MERVVRIALSLYLLSSASGQLYTGDPCTNKDGSTGVCKPMKNCLSAIADMKKGKNPTICSFQGFDPVVCCSKQIVTEPQKISSTTTTTTTHSPEPVDRTGSKATQMCQEYSQAVWRYDRPAVLLFGAKPTKTNLCFNSAQGLIIGGVKAVPKEFPHMVLVGFGDKNDISWWCGGSLISPQFVLTAGHCLDSRQKGVARWVRVGDLNIKEVTDKVVPQEAAVVERIPHPDYKPPATYNDIALLKLDRNLTLNEYVRPACLHTTLDIGSSQGIATGWGRTNWAQSQGSDDLMKVGLPIQPTESCNATYKLMFSTNRLNKGITGDSMVCAGRLEGNKDTCKGDSGGPLQLLMEKPYCMYDIIGVTSFGKTVCGAEGSPAVYTRVSHFVPWIEKIVWP